MFGGRFWIVPKGVRRTACVQLKMDLVYDLLYTRKPYYSEHDEKHKFFITFISHPSLIVKQDHYMTHLLNLYTTFCDATDGKSTVM
jgi:hypothetical protein